MARLIETTDLHRGWSRLMRATIETDGGKVIHREVEDHGHAVAVLPYDPERRTALLVRQLRSGPLLNGEADPHLLEAPAGMIDAGETPETAARREALEEIGVRLGDLTPLGRAYSSPTITTESLTLFLATCSVADRVAGGGGLADEGEEIEVVEMALSDLAALIDSGGLNDMKTLVLASRLRHARPDLFEPT